MIFVAENNISNQNGFAIIYNIDLKLIIISFILPFFFSQIMAYASG